jgi:hypothetical protein
VENDGHQIEEDNCFPSKNRQIDIGGKQYSVTFSSRLLQQAS